MLHHWLSIFFTTRARNTTARATNTTVHAVDQILYLFIYLLWSLVTTTIDKLSKHFNAMSNFLSFPIVRAKNISLDEIVYLEGSRNYTFVYFKDGSRVLYSKTLKSFEKSMLSENFIRVSKTHIIHKDFILKLCSSTLEVTLKNGKKISMSRRRRIRRGIA